MTARVLKALSEIKDDTCIVAHGGVIAAIMEHLVPHEGNIDINGSHVPVADGS